MRSVLLFTFLFCMPMRLPAQDITDSALIDYTPYKGKLIVINETHMIATKDLVYQQILQQISRQAAPGDTINVIMEQSYAVSYLLNRAMSGEIETDSPITIKNLPIRFVGVDFERPYSKTKYYSKFLKAMLDKLSALNIPTNKLQAYYDDAATGYIVLNNASRRPIIAQYKEEQKKYAKGSREYQAIAQLLFALKANHHISSLKNRDKNTFNRLLEAEENGFVNFKNNYNILIHGTCHTDPTMKNDIYNRFQKDKMSPFLNNTYLIGQAYIECTSAGDYFRHAPTLISGNIFCDDQKKQPLVDAIRSAYKGKLLPGNVLLTKSINTMPEIARYKDRVIAWYVHWKVPLENNP